LNESNSILSNNFKADF